MLFKKKVTEKFMISIPEPCSEDWNKMSVVDREHRHCSSCEKNVVDFTAMSDDEIVLYFRNTNQKICGRFANHQLNKSFTALPKTTRSSNWWKAAMLLPLSLYTKSSAAQQQNDSVPSQDSTIVNSDSLDHSAVSNLDSSFVAADSVVQNVDSGQFSPEIIVSEIPQEIKFAEITGLYEGSISWGWCVPTIFMGDVAPQSIPLATIEFNPPVEQEHAPVKLDFLDPGDILENETRMGVTYNPPFEELPETIMKKMQDNRDNISPTPPKTSENEEKQPDHIPPTIPDQPWYEAILPSSLRPRRNG